MTPAQVNDIFRDNEVPLDEAAAERVRMLEAGARRAGSRAMGGGARRSLRRESPEVPSER